MMTEKSFEILFLSRRDIETAGLHMSDVIAIVEEAFRQKGRHEVEVPPKPGIHPMPDAFIHAMPAYLPKMRAAGIKWVSGYPENPKRGLPYISGLLVLNDPDTGIPSAVMDATWITANRTGAATAVAAKHLARLDSTILGILGCGVQGRSNLEALLEILPKVSEVRAYDISHANQQRYVEEMSVKFQPSVIAINSPQAAVKDCDIVVTAGPILKHPEPTIEKSWIKEGVFACPIDFDSYWKPEAMLAMDKFCTDDLEQLQYYCSQGYFQKIPDVHGDLGEIVLGRKVGRERREERIMSMNLGLAIEDMAVAVKLVESAKRQGVGTWLKL